MFSSMISGGRHFTWVLLTCMFIFCNLSMELAAHSRNTSPRAPNCSTASLTGEIKKIQKGWATRTGLCAGETSAIVAMPTQVPEDHGKGPKLSSQESMSNPKRQTAPRFSPEQLNDEKRGACSAVACRGIAMNILPNQRVARRSKRKNGPSPRNNAPLLSIELDCLEPLTITRIVSRSS